MASTKNTPKLINKQEIYRNLHDIKAAMSDSTDEVKTKVCEMITELLNDMTDTAPSDQLANLEDCVIDYVTENPLKSLLMSTAFGIALGKLIL